MKPGDLVKVDTAIALTQFPGPSRSVGMLNVGQVGIVLSMHRDRNMLEALVYTHGAVGWQLAQCFTVLK